MQQYIKTIRNVSNIGLWFSLGVAMLTILFVLLSKYQFYPDPRTYQFFLIAGSVLAIAAAMLMLLSVRRSIPKLRQLDSVEERFRRYADHIKYMYIGTMVCIVIECAFIILSSNRQLIMFLIILVMMLFLAFPNIYRIKVDLGLTNAQMQELFGNDYIPDPVEETSDAEIIEADETDESNDSSNHPEA